RPGPVEPRPPRECNRTTQPWIEVISPNGGEVYRAGDTLSIRWTTCNHPFNIDTLVALMDDRIPDWQTVSLFGSVPALNHATLVSSQGNQHTYEYSFVIPETFNGTLPPQYQNIYGGLHYKINVVIGGPQQEDWSDDLFTI